MDLNSLGTIIRERREALGLTQSRLAQLSGLSRQTLVGLEAGALSDLGAHFSDRGHPFHADRGHRFTPMADSAQGMRVTGFIVSQVSAMAVKSPVLSTPARSAGVGNSAPKAMLV